MAHIAHEIRISINMDGYFKIEKGYLWNAWWNTPENFTTVKMWIAKNQDELFAVISNQALPIVRRGSDES